MSGDLTDLGLNVQLRDIPAIRVARLRYGGAPAEIGAAFTRVTDFAVRHGVGPCGPVLGVFPRLAVGVDSIEAMVCAPLTRLPASDEADIETLRLPRSRAACLIYAGPMTSEFRQCHLDLFAWMDSRGVPRDGTMHQHAYLAGTGPDSEWTVEIRVPVLGGHAPVTPI
jgi:effector-binding domain-containing protein